MTYEFGISTHSGARIDPPLHVIRYEGNRPLTWCGGGKAIPNVRNVHGRVCSRCRTLMREAEEELK